MGVRDRDRTLEKKPGEFRIALVGDSVVEAVQVKSPEVMNIQMEELLQKRGHANTEVLAFGIGGIGTTQEMMLCEQKIRQFHPDLVILTVSDNDVMNDSSTLQPEAYGIHTWYAPILTWPSTANLCSAEWRSGPLNGRLNFDWKWPELPAI